MSDLYDDTVDVSRKSFFGFFGEGEETTSLKSLRESDIGLLREFAKDDDIQYMQVCSTNIGMIRTYQKRFAQKTDEQ